MTAWGEVREAAQKVVSRIKEAYAGQREERYGGEVIVSPQELLQNRMGAERVIEEHLRRLTRDGCFSMLGDRWSRPGAPVFSFKVDDRDDAYRAGQPSYGPGTLRLRMDMGSHPADLKLPEANAELTKALIGALAVAFTNADPRDLPGRRLIEESRRLLHAHGSPEVIALMAAMVEAHGGRPH